jgi:hypothetical protein
METKFKKIDNKTSFSHKCLLKNEWKKSEKYIR